MFRLSKVKTHNPIFFGCFIFSLVEILLGLSLCCCCPWWFFFTKKLLGVELSVRYELALLFSDVSYTGHSPYCPAGRTNINCCCCCRGRCGRGRCLLFGKNLVTGGVKAGGVKASPQNAIAPRARLAKAACSAHCNANAASWSLQQLIRLCLVLTGAAWRRIASFISALSTSLFMA
jgi:hypothetical protein